MNVPKSDIKFEKLQDVVDNFAGGPSTLEFTLDSAKRIATAELR